MKCWFKVAVISAAMSWSVAIAGLFDDLYTCGEVDDAGPSVPGNGKDRILRTVSHGAGMNAVVGERECASGFHFFRFDHDGCLVVFTNGCEVAKQPEEVSFSAKMDLFRKMCLTNEVGYVYDAKEPDKYGVMDSEWRESPWGICYDKSKEIDPAKIYESICARHGNVFSDTSREAGYLGAPVNKFWNRAMGKGLLLLKDDNYCCKFDSSGHMTFSGPFDLCEEGCEYANRLAAVTNERREEWAKLHGLTRKQAEDGYAEYVTRKGGLELNRLPCGCLNIDFLTKEAGEEMFEGLDSKTDNEMFQKIIEDIVAFSNALEKALCVCVGQLVDKIVFECWVRGKNKRTLEELVEKMRKDHVWTRGCGKSLFVADDGGFGLEPQYCHGFRFDSQGQFIGYGQFQKWLKGNKDED